MSPPLCHPERKHKAKGKCSPCYARYLREVNPEFAERQRKAHSKYQKNNRPTKDEKRTSTLRWRYGLEAGEYEQKLASQNGRCAICARPPSGARPLSVDHDHSMNRARDLLCQRCNVLVGQLEKNPELVEPAMGYIARWGACALAELTRGKKK